MGDDSLIPTTSSSLSFTTDTQNHFKFFLENMTRHDRMHGTDAIVLFQPIAEASKELGKHPYIPCSISNLEKAYPLLSELNQKGWSLHWSLNEYGYARELPDNRKKNRVSRVRCFAVDIDKPISIPLVNELISKSYPTAVVLSSRKTVGMDVFQPANNFERQLFVHYQPEIFIDEDEQGPYSYSDLYKAHFYWQLHSTFGERPFGTEQLLSREEESLKENWHLFQNALAWWFDEEINYRLGMPEDEQYQITDKGLRPLSQTLRLPGFYHLKDPQDCFLTQSYYANSENVVSLPLLPVWLAELGIDTPAIQNYEDTYQEWKKRLRGVRTVPKKREGDAVVLTENEYEAGYGGAEQGNRNNELHRYACHLIWKRNFSRAEALAVCLNENRVRNVPPLEDLEVESIVESAWIEHERQRAENVQTRMQQGDSNAAATNFKNFFQKQRKNNNTIGKLTGSAPQDLASAADSLKPEPIHVADATWEQRIDSSQRFTYDYTKFKDFLDLTSDVSIVDRICQRFESGLKLHPDGDLWVWEQDEGVWKGGDKFTVPMIKKCTVDMCSEPGVLTKFFKANGEVNEEKFERFRVGLHSERRFSSVIKKLKREHTLTLDNSELSPPAWLFNCRNGAIDLQTGKVVDHARKYFFTLRSNILLREGTEDTCSSYLYLDTDELLERNRWTRFVFEIMNEDLEMYYYLQKIAGYLLAAGNPYELMFFMYGAGNNGKSLFTETLGQVFGDFFFSVPSDVFLQAGKDRASILSQLVGKRMVLTSELGSNRRWNEESIKDVTGADRINVRPLYKSSFVYKPEFKVIVRGNYRPKLGGTDYGVWRRIRPIPFDRIYYPHEADLSLPRQFSSPEMLYEVLCWAVAGYQMVQDEGIAPPQRAAEAYVEYRNQTMPILGFIAEVFDLPASGVNLGSLESGVGMHGPGVNGTGSMNGTVSGPAHGVPSEFADQIDAAKLYRLYLCWFGRRASDKMTENEVFEACESLGIKKLRVMMCSEKQKEKTPQPHYILGLRVRPEWELKASTGRGIYGRDENMTAAILKERLQ